MITRKCIAASLIVDEEIARNREIGSVFSVRGVFFLSACLPDAFNLFATDGVKCRRVSGQKGPANRYE